MKLNNFFIYNNHLIVKRIKILVPNLDDIVGHVIIGKLNPSRRLRVVACQREGSYDRNHTAVFGKLCAATERSHHIEEGGILGINVPVAIALVALGIIHKLDLVVANQLVLEADDTAVTATAEGEAPVRAVLAEVEIGKLLTQCRHDLGLDDIPQGRAEFAHVAHAAGPEAIDQGSVDGRHNAVQHNIEVEKMAIVIQEVVGSRFGQYFYPHISGVAQSYNFYPVADMKPEEGYAVAGVGLGCYVVGGWPSYRFSPKYPTVSMYTKNDLLKSTQTKFYALDCSLKNIDLLNGGEYAALKLLNIYDAEKHGSLKHLVSVYNPDNDSFSPGLDDYGPRIVNFADVLQYNYFPLAETISVILNAVKDAFGSAVEIEYAVNLNKAKNGKPSFYLLQIKPMVGSFEDKHIDLQQENQDNMLLYTNQSLGNGILSDISDVIYIDEQKFSKLETVEMAREINYLNTLFKNENKRYVLIGPGRWGTSDRFLGVPVQWSEISNAAVIIETSMEGYPLDFSHGSHFFHNITSMNIGYFAIRNENRNCFIKREILEDQELIHQTKYFRHVRFSKPLNIIMNGSKNEAAIMVK
jgi:hypothetical protein